MADIDLATAPTFSVVIPLYQKRHRIEACLASVRSQTLQPQEVIVVDDGSTDGGGELVKEIGGGWVRYVRQANQGVSAARNAGVKLARASHVAFLDADDTWRENHLQTLSALATRHPDAAILGTGWLEKWRPPHDDAIGPGDTVIDLEFYLKRTVENFTPFWTSAVGIRKSAVRTDELFPIGSRVAEDQDAWLYMLSQGTGVRSAEITAEYFLDEICPTVAKPKPEDFGSVIFTKWSENACYDSKSYWEFVASHRLYTIERHVGHSANSLLIRHLLNTKTTAQPIRRLKIILRIIYSAFSKTMRRTVRLAADCVRQ